MVAGMAIAATAATLASFSGLRGLAALAGWPDRLAWLLPVTLDAYAMTSARVWLADGPGSPRARRFARANALGAITASIAGNAAFHLAGAGLLDVTAPVIVVVGAVPAAVLGLIAHLHALRTPAPTLRPAPGSAPPRPPRPRTTAPVARPDDAALLAAARAADVAHRRTHGGRPITRDALRVALRISGPRATELLRRLRADTAPVPRREENQTP